MREVVSGGAAVIDALVAQGVSTVFGIPGTHNLELYRHLPSSGIRHVVTRHEQGAGYAADGYARVSGHPGVLITTSGPGITNAITALATSYADSVPTLAISPGAPRGRVGADVGWLHELKNQQAALDAVTDRSIRVESADQLPEVIADVFEGFATRRPRPVHVEIPVDVLEGDWLRRPCERRPQPAPGRPATTDVEAVADALARASSPVAIVGGGARHAADHVRGLADLGIPVLTTVNGKGVLDERHPSSLGAAARLTAAHEVVNDADVLLVIGSELGDSDLWGGTVAPGRPGERTVIRIDVDPGQLHKNVRADIPVLGDSAAVVGPVVDALRSRGAPARQAASAERARGRIDAEAALRGEPWAGIQRSLAAALPDNTVVAGDSSQVTYYGTVHHWTFGTGNRLLYPTGYATLGYGLPAAIGAKMADPTRPVVALFGDGAAMFSIQELVTATELGLGLPVVVVDNGGYAEIREQMVDRGIRPQAVDLHQPDLPALARAVGAHGVEISDAADLGRAAAAALTADRPTLIHHRVTGPAPA